MKANLLSILNKARAEKRQIALITDVVEGAQTLIVDGEIVGGTEPDPGLRKDATAAVENDRCKIVSIGDTRYFIQQTNELRNRRETYVPYIWLSTCKLTSSRTVTHVGARPCASPKLVLFVPIWYLDPI